MTVMETINRINSDIAALPAEYRGLVKTEEDWAADHPFGCAAILIAFGLGLGFVAGFAL